MIGDMRDKGMACSACGTDFGTSRYWWTLEIRSWLHDRLSGPLHDEQVRLFQEELRRAG